jgi:magnesium-protoporphyrin O-methyltransferase
VNCCSAPPPGWEIFDERQARRDARRYRRKGLGKTERWLIDSIAPEDGDVLEIGGGVGALEIELLRGGAGRATNVELSPAYEEEAASLLHEAGLEGRVERRVLDFAIDHADVPAADVVVMHRVVCCYPDVDALVEPAAAKARRALALTFPRDTWWMRAGVWGANVWMRISGRAFRSYVHDPARIFAAATNQGLVRTRDHCGLIWRLAAFERPA